MFSIYLIHPIAGQTQDEVNDYYIDTSTKLCDHYNILSPLYEKGFLRTADKAEMLGEFNPVSTDSAIYGRDHWMVCKSDIVYANLLNANRVSIGSVCEIAWAAHQHKHVVITMDKDNVHRHLFITESADIIFDKHEDAINYLKKLANHKGNV